MDWQRYLEQIHRSVSNSEINPRECTEKGFFEWIIDRGDVQTQLESWLMYRKNECGESRKDNEKATQYREEGNNYFKTENYPASVKSYTESARYSGDDVNFSIAIANRSAAFFYMGRYNESLRDIELALKMGYPEELLWKLHRRAAQSHLKLRQGNLAEASIAKLRNVVKNSCTIAGAMKETILKQANDLSAACESQNKYENYPATAKTLPRPEDMMTENSIFRFASTAVVRKSSPIRGRYVIAGQPIKKGDILFVEKPFAWVPVMHGHNGSMCIHCSGPLDDSLVPCRRCVNASYCNSTCWNDAWSNHKWECSGYHLGIWQQIASPHLAFKVFLMSVTTSDKVWFNDVQNLVTNVDRQSASDIFRVAISSMLLTTYMETCTNFFETVDLKECLIEKFADPDMSFDFDTSTKRGKKLYAGSMILRHALQMLANPYAVVRRVDTSPSFERETFDSITANRRGSTAGAYPSALMLNHSCDPTVKYSFWKNRLVVKAIKDMREGEEIFVCYGPHFKTMVKAERKMYLRSRYCFDCECSACRNPLFDHYTDRFNGLKCPKCFGPAIRSPTFDNQRCLDCGAINEVTCDVALQRANELYDKGMELSDMQKWKEAIPYFERSLVIRGKYMYKHNEDVALTLNALGNSYAEIGDWLKSISYLEKRIAALEERYGSDSPEVASGCIRMTEVCFQYLNDQPNHRSQEYLDTFIKTGEYGDRVLAMTCLIVDPWNDKYQEVHDKRERLSKMLEILRML